MKTRRFIVTILLTLVGVMAVPSIRAQDAVKEKKVSKKVLEKYDTNKDGVLSPEEEAAWKADKEKARAEREAKKKAKADKAEKEGAATAEPER